MFFRSGNLLNVSNIKSFQRAEIYMELVRTVQKLSLKRFSNVITPLLNDSRVQEQLPFYRSTLESMTSSSYFEVLGTERLFEYYHLIIKAQATKINRFIKDREKFEQLFLAGDYDKCENFLKDFKCIYGESIWWIKSKLLVLFYRQHSEETQEFCDEILGRTGNGLFTYYINSLIQCTHASSPLADLDRKITKAIEEFDKAAIPAVSWFVQKLCFPEILALKEENLENLYLLQQLPIIDIYHFTTSSALLYKNTYATPKTKILDKQGVCKKFITSISLVVNDNRLRNFQNENHQKTAPISTLEESIICKYESGLYLDVLEIMENKICQLLDPMTFTNIVAKSCVRTAKTFTSGWHIFDDTVKNLADIHSLSPRASQARLEIQERIIRLNGTELGIQLQAALAIAMPQFFPERVLIKTLKVANFSCQNSLPLTRSLIDNGRNVYGEKYQFLDPINVPLERASRCRSPKASPDPRQTNDYIFTISSSPHIKKDHIEYTARHLAFNKQFDALVEFASKCLTEYPECYICFPMDDILVHIENIFMHTIDAVIACHFYVKFISSSKRTLLNEIFEEHLYSLNKNKPSDLLGEFQVKSRNLELLFFNDVCSFESLDFLDSFQSSDELRSERVTIIEHLYSRKLISRESYSKELEQIIKLVVLDAATSNFSRSKIYVDQTSIKRKIREEVSTYFELYQITKNTDQDSDDGLLFLSERISDDETFESGVMSGQQSSLLIKIIEVIHHAFLFDEAFGLDANLSSEIRHGIFSNFMLSEVDSKHLISEKNDNGTYKPISYWHEFYSSWLIPSLMKQLDKNFAWFSEQYSELINEAERWMKIGYAKSGVCFDFSIYTDDYAKVKAIAVKCASADEVIEEVLAILWSKTEEGLLSLKDRINSKFKHDIEELFTELTAKITATKGNAVLNEIMTNIETANNNTKEIIAEITEWFAQSESKIFDEQTLIQLIDISISCFERIKGRKLKISRNLSLDAANFRIPGQHVNSMILAIVNLLTNAIRHSGLDINVEIYISALTIEKGYQIRISNTLSNERFGELDESFFIVFNNNLNAPESLELLRQEGGTGLAKAFHHLKTADPGFDLKVLLTDGNFCTEVNYVSINSAG